MHRLAYGYYVVVPQENLGEAWMPALEAAAAGIATAHFGADNVVLMGVTAARMHGAIPRALGTAVVAVPAQRNAIALADQDATVQFVKRDTAALDADTAAPCSSHPRPRADRVTDGRDTATMQEVADQFGVAAEQVRRDHLISHILSALSRELSEQVIFFGGTALARTHLPAGRLSEDIDLIAVGARTPTATSIERVLATALRRSHGREQCGKQIAATLRVTPDGARAIMELQLRRFTPDASGRIRNERIHLMEHINPQ